MRWRAARLGISWPVPHDRELYECSLTRSSGAPAMPGPRDPRRYDAPCGAPHRPAGHPRARAGVPRRDAADRRDPEEPVRRRELGRRPSVPPRLLHGHRAALRHRAARRRPPPLPRRLRAVGPQLRRVPRAHDVPPADRGLDLGGRPRPLLLGERDPAGGVRGRRRRMPVPDRSAPLALVRARPEPGAAGLRELGPLRRRAHDGGDAGVLPTPRRVGGCAGRPGDGRQALPRPAARPVRRGAAPRTPTRSARSSCGGPPPRRGSP